MAAMSLSQGNVRVKDFLRAFDLPLEGRSEADRFAIAFALRGIRYYSQAWDVAARWPEAGVGVLRSLIDLAILSRWLEGDPRLRLALYKAQDDRDRIRTSDGFNRVRAGRGFPALMTFTSADRRHAERRAWLLRRVATARPDERVASRARDSLLPSIFDRAELGGDAVELYWSFQLLSQTIHVNGRAFVGDRLVRRADGTHLRAKSAIPGDMVRGLAVPALCTLLASTSRQLGLGLDGDLDALRLALAGWTAPGS